MQSGVTAEVGRKDMARVSAIANRAFARDPEGVGDSVTVLTVQRPAEIVNYQSTGGTPEVLAGGLGAGAAIALALALVATVRRRRPDLALLKTLGFTGRQLAGSLASQATVTAIVGIVLGIPLGVVAGRQLWILFAHDINAVPQPAVPASIAFVALGALLLAIAVATIPARAAAATPAGISLRQE